MSENNIHDASGQLTGYLYQVLSALLLLLGNKNPDSQLCIEKFDDVAFVEKDTPQIMIQVKHQLNRQGNLGDTSTDYWRTIKSWCDYIKNSNNFKATTDFVIITTAKAKNNSIAFFLQNMPSRDWKKALEIMRQIACSNTSKTNKNYYDAFNSLSNKQQEALVKRIYICDMSPNIGAIKESIMPYVRVITLQPFEDRVYEKIVGWWIISTIQCLISDKPVFISYRQLQKKMNDIGGEYKADSLPIDVDPYYQPTDDELDQLPLENRIFIKQLGLIAISDSRLKRCIRDYYNAFCQRSQWVREQLLFVNDLEAYEKRLIDEWNRLYLIMKEDLEDYGDQITENQKQIAGKKLFGEIENLSLPIRSNVPEPFIMRGTYHELANRLAVGWHVDFMNRLYKLLKG